MKKIRMIASMGGPDFEWSPGQELEVDDELALALCTLPEDGPRAEPLGWEIPGHEGEIARGIERATAPAEDKRETATQGTSKRQVKPPAKPPDE